MAIRNDDSLIRERKLTLARHSSKPEHAKSEFRIVKVPESRTRQSIRRSGRFSNTCRTGYLRGSVTDQSGHRSQPQAKELAFGVLLAFDCPEGQSTDKPSLKHKQKQDHRHDHDDRGSRKFAPPDRLKANKSVNSNGNGSGIVVGQD